MSADLQVLATPSADRFVGPSIAYIVIRQGVKCRMAAKAFDEMNSGAADSVRAPYRAVANWLAQTSPEKVAATRHEVDLFYRRHGITFGAYGAVDGAETTIPFDIIPRVIAWDEWEYLHKGLVQRVRALNAFLADAYGEREICRAGVIPEQQVLMNAEFVAMAQGLELPGGVHAHIAGIDLVRVGEKDFYVLEDNVRTPSGVSYVLENREVMMRLAPELFSAMRVLPVADYTEELLATLRSVSFSDDAEPNVVLLTPGHYNSAYFEHAFLADEMGIELVKGSDLFVDEGRVYMRTPRGPQRVDVIYRRVDDAFLDPLAMRPDSFLGVAGPAGRIARRPRQHRQCAGQRRRRRQVDLHLRARDGALLSRRGADPATTCRPGAATAPTTSSTCSSVCPSWS